MGGSDLASVTREMWNNYIGLNVTQRIFNALSGQSTYSNVRILAYGMQGSGKTTFMYYAIKVAFTRYLCHRDGVVKENCLEHAMKEYSLCLGRDCPRDKVDEQLLPGFYLTVDDLLKRFLKDVTSGEISSRRIVFFDDAFTPKVWWNLGGRWRELYHVAKTFDQFYRDNINVLVLTAPNLYYFTKDYIVNSLVLHIEAKRIEGASYILAVHFRFPLHMGYFRGEPHLVRLRQLDFIDKVPIRRPFGIPKWLEELNTERRQYVLKQAALKAMKAMKREIKGGA